MLCTTKYEGKEMDACDDLTDLWPSGLIFCTFFESDLVIVVTFALLYGIHYIITIRPKPGKFGATTVQGWRCSIM